MFLEYIMYYIKVIKAWQKKFEALIWHTNIFNWKKNWGCHKNQKPRIVQRNPGPWKSTPDIKSLLETVP